MDHQHVVNQWAELLEMIEKAKPTTEHPEAHACLDAIKQMAEEHTKLMLEHKAKAEAKKDTK